jgi:hypothetical protein
MWRWRTVFMLEAGVRPPQRVEDIAVSLEGLDILRTGKQTLAAEYRIN